MKRVREQHLLEVISEMKMTKAKLSIYEIKKNHFNIHYFHFHYLHIKIIRKNEKIKNHIITDRARTKNTEPSDSSDLKRMFH